MPAGYYTWRCRRCCAPNARLLSPARRAELDRFGAACRDAPEFAGMVQTCSITCCRARRRGRRAAAEPGRAARATTASTACSTSRSRPTCDAGRIGLAQNRLPVTSTHRGCRARTTCSMPRRLPRCYRRAGMEALADGRSGGGHAGGRRRQPLDQGRGRGQGAQPVLQARRAAPQLPRGASGEEPARRPRSAARCCRTSSPPATSPTTPSSSYLRARGQLRLPRAAAALARRAASGCA